MLQFKVVCFKQDIGIFTGYGAKIKSFSPTPIPPPHPMPPHPHAHCVPGHIPHDPYFTDKCHYEVVVYINPELTQSITIYEDKSIEICRLVLNNFIKMVLNGANIIDLNKINDRTPIHLCENYNDKFDCKPDFCNPWEKNWKDPRKNPYFTCFDEVEHHHCPPPPFFDEHDCKPMPIDGDIVSFRPDHYHDNHHCHGNDEIDNWKDDCHCHDEHHHHHCHDKIVFYFGNGGFSMGESVTDSIVEISDRALRDMLEKNHHSTFSNMNPRDTINVKKYVRDTICPHDTFDTCMDIAGEWCFIMIPDKYYKLIKEFNWYYQDETTDNQWKEAPFDMSEQTFTIQDNGCRYFINAIRLNGDYAVRFAKSGISMTNPPDCTFPNHCHDDDRYLNPEMKYRVTIMGKDASKLDKDYILLKEVDDETKSAKLKFNSLDTTWFDAIPNKIYKLVKVTVTEDSETERDVIFFNVVENHNFKKGFSVWTSITNSESDFVDTKTDLIKFNLA